MFEPAHMQNTTDKGLDIIFSLWSFLFLAQNIKNTRDTDMMPTKQLTLFIIRLIQIKLIWVYEIFRID